MHIYIHTHTHSYKNTYIQTHKYIHIYIYTLTNIHKKAYIQTHTYINTRPNWIREHVQFDYKTELFYTCTVSNETNATFSLS